MTTLESFLDRRSPAEVTAMGLALVALVGALDYLTGYELSFSIFYLAPIAMVAWRAPRRTALLFCGLSALVWLAMDSASGHTYAHWGIPFWNAAVRFGFFAATAGLLAELKARLEREQTLARTDGLTGALNARAFHDVSGGLLMLGARRRDSAAMGYLDLDDFKKLNDSLGHAEGDRALQKVAEILTRCVRTSDVVGRLGGDEFAVLLPDCDLAGARTVFDRLHGALKEEAADQGWPISFSIGVAVFPQVPAGDWRIVLKVADRLMYEVKKAGKDQVAYEEQAVPQPASRA